jgi:ABC-type transport system involved in cytochrome c biogenesis permease subunit
MSRLFKIVPWLVLALFGAEIIAVYLPKREKEFHTRDFSRLPVLMNGRVQPFDTVGRNALLQIRSTGEVPLEMAPSWKFWHHPKKLKPGEWLLEVFFKPELADTRHIFRIHHHDIIEELKLADKGVEKSGLRYYTFEQIRPKLQEIEQRAGEARQIDDKQRNAFQKQILALHYGIFVYQSLKSAARPPEWLDFQGQLAEFETNLPAGLEALNARQEGKEFDKEALSKFWEPVMGVLALARDPNAGRVYPLVIPPAEPGQKREDWSTVSQALMSALQTKRVPEPVRAFAAMGTAFAQTNAAAFNVALAGYKHWLGKDFGRESRKGGNEFFFNDTKAFLHALIIYVMAFLLASAALLTVSSAPRLGESLRKSAFYLVLLAFAVHSFGLFFRMYLEARPPVTNLYSSAIFIGWGAVLLGLFLERFYRFGLGSAVGSLTGFVTLIIAHNLALGGDTMEMMRAVLDSNFWLTTHVITITIGYSANFVAGLLGIAYVLLGLLTPLLRLPAGKFTLGQALSRMVYAIICFATLFSFIGTVLGGIWADQSWGRFWGWDPKENGALLIVLWNAAILHARWGGIARDRGLMNMAIFGNIITSFSWFGVNMLGVGLHSYGFMDAAFFWLSIFMGSQAALIGLGCLPLSLWRSFSSRSGGGSENEGKPPQMPPDESPRQPEPT